MLRQCFDLPYGLYEGAVGICTMSAGLLWDAKHVRVLLTAFSIMLGMRVPIYGGTPPC
ncbi:MAG TPA: hypothetical protein VK667_02195 [Ktedonobacteraceae bacterium]|nr:hypothetical protein [Ktedonobacteraceae bacterium]